jgi:hypothetical protein
METVDASANNNVSWHHMLKLIVVMGFPSSGKTTCLKGRTVSPLLQGLCNILSGGTDVPVGTKENCREALCMVNGKTVNVYFGADGDSEDIVYENIENIGKSPLPYDVAIITLQRRPVDANLTVGTVWQKWIDRSIQNYNTNNPTRQFPDHERYYVPTGIPQFCFAANGYVGKIGTQVVNLPNLKMDDLTKCTQGHIVSLLSLIV